MAKTLKEIHKQKKWQTRVQLWRVTIKQGDTKIMSRADKKLEVGDTVEFKGRDGSWEVLHVEEAPLKKKKLPGNIPEQHDREGDVTQEAITNDQVPAEWQVK